MQYNGLEISANEEVYEPAEDSFLAASLLSEYLSGMKNRGIRVLDMGTGTGILGLLASSSPLVKEVVFADVNKAALQLAKSNSERNGSLLKATQRFILSDLFSEIGEEEFFDLILFNAPYLRNEKDDEEKEHNPWSGGKEGVELSIRFLDGVASHLNQDGKVILVASSLSNLKMLEEKINGLGFSALRKKKVHIFFEDIIAVLIARK